MLVFLVESVRLSLLLVPVNMSLCCSVFCPSLWLLHPVVDSWVPPPRPIFFSISCSFSANLAKSCVGDPSRGLTPPPMGNPGSATGGIYQFERYICQNDTWVTTMYLVFDCHSVIICTRKKLINYWLWNFQRYPKTLVSLSCHKIVDGGFF